MARERGVLGCLRPSRGCRCTLRVASREGAGGQTGRRTPRRRTCRWARSSRCACQRARRWGRPRLPEEEPCSRRREHGCLGGDAGRTTGPGVGDGGCRGAGDCWFAGLWAVAAVDPVVESAHASLQGNDPVLKPGLVPLRAKIDWDVLFNEWWCCSACPRV